VESLQQAHQPSLLPEAIRDQLWQRVDARLARGDALVTSADFLRALEADYFDCTGKRVTRPLRAALRSGVIHKNRDHPERYVGIGAQNSVNRAFQSGCLQLEWDPVRIAVDGPLALARFKSRDRIRDLLFGVGLKPALIDDGACIEHAILVVSGGREPLARRDHGEPLAPPTLGVVSSDATDTTDVPTPASGPDEDLTADEIRLGALVARVEMRVAGGTRRVPSRLVRHPDDPTQYVLAKRNAASGALEPAMRRGAYRLVERQSDGVWQAVG